MARMSYEHVFSAAGFSGESFDVAKGYDVTYTTTAGDLVFDNTASVYTLTLSAGTWPIDFRVVGKTFTTGSVTNPGPFTVKAMDVTNKIMTVQESVTNETPVGTTLVDGAKDPQIISVLLKTGSGDLTTDAPHFLRSTGALGGARTLGIAGLEAESALQGSQPLNGRFFYLSMQNSDLSTNNLTVTSSATINGAASLVITTAGDYLFHHFAAGEWRANLLPRVSESHATIARVPFTSAMWDAGANKESIKIIPSGSPAAGEAGPHGLTVAGSYIVQVINTDLSPDEIVDVEVQFDALGNITMVKAKKAPDFNGIAIIVGAV
jgi:hypothetical protein